MGLPPGARRVERTIQRLCARSTHARGRGGGGDEGRERDKTCGVASVTSAKATAATAGAPRRLHSARFRSREHAGMHRRAWGECRCSCAACQGLHAPRGGEGGAGRGGFDRHPHDSGAAAHLHAQPRGGWQRSSAVLAARRCADARGRARATIASKQRPQPQEREERACDEREAAIAGSLARLVVKRHLRVGVERARARAREVDACTRTHTHAR